MIYLEITEQNDQIIFTNIPIRYKGIFQNNKNSKDNKVRSIYKKDSDNMGLWMISDNKDIYKSAKVALKSYTFFQEIFIGIYKHYELITLSNTHTIATIQAKMSQQIESLVGSSNQRGNYQKVIGDVKNLINQDPEKASEVICGLNKRIEEIDTHLKSLRILENRTAVDLKNHPLKNMLLNIYSPFKDSFIEKNIKVRFDRVNDGIKIIADYKIFSLVMHHFFDNAVKYSKRDDEISFIFSVKNELIITMHSIKIEDHNEIFEIGVSGKNADSLSGDGIGMHVIKKGLNIMNMDITIMDKGKLEKHQKFNKNCFIITTWENPGQSEPPLV